MHPSRQPTGPTDPQSPTRHGETSSSDPPPSAYSSQTSLPSIRQLHPYLPLSPLSQHHHTSSGDSSGYNYPQFAHQLPQGDPQTLGVRRSSEAFGSPDSDGDETEQRHGPPKKKRRRQPLSCTECKRRKIKCDRAQPCAPCTRRGEQSRCQWHVIEPVEKYVTRAEYDELKARFDELYAQVQRLLPTATVPPYYQMGIPSTIPGTSTEAVSTYASGPLMYQSMMAPPHTYSHPLDASTQGPQERFIKPEDIQTSSRHHHASIGPTSTVPSPHGTSSMRTRPPEKSPASTAVGITTGTKIKKLLRADAHAGRASAHRISSSSRRPSDTLRVDPSSSSASITNVPPAVAGTSSEIYGDSSVQTSASAPVSLRIQPQSPSTRRFIDSSLPPILPPRDEDGESLTHFPRGR